MTKRMEYIDMMKGFAMILVILGHIWYIPQPLKICIYFFHIPLFFFLSGFTFSIKKYTSFKPFFMKKFKTIMLPYFLLNTGVFMFKSIMLHPENILKIDILYFIKALLLADRLHIYYQLWFLTSLFLAELVSYFVVKFSNNFKKWILSFFLLLILGYLGQKAYVNDYYLIWSLDTVPYATIFILSGYIVKSNIHNVSRLLKKRYFIPAVTTTILIGILNYKLTNTMVDLYYQDVNYWPFYFLSGFLGIWATIIFFKNIRTIKAIQKIGENTLIYYAVHSPIVLYILNIIFEQLITRYTGIFVNNYIVIFFYLPVTLILCELIARIINNTFPILLGKNKPI